MKTFLMYPDRDFDRTPPSKTEFMQFAQDLELGVLLNTAAADDRYIYDTMAAACATAWENEAAVIRYRQDILKDCLANPTIVRQLYAIAITPFDRNHSWDFSLFGHDASSMVGSGVRALQSSLGVLRRLRDACSTNVASFTSKGFRQFFSTLERDLDDAYLAAADADLTNLKFRKGVLLSVRIGDGGRGVGTMLRKPQPRGLSWVRTMLTPGGQSYTLQLDPHDDAGAQAFGELQNKGLGLICDAVYQSAEHVLNFLKALRAELSFYIGCLNLSEQLTHIGEVITFPDVNATRSGFVCRNLRDIGLVLTIQHRVVGNDIDADGKSLVIITGANSGGKSTFLRSVGLAQLMLQCGLFVTADSFKSSLHTGLFTHFKRKEDRNLRSGKFDEELVRMSGIADHLRRDSLILFNESFAATHEREGSEIARQIVTALLDNDIMVFFVSHMYEFARSFIDDERVLFLRADRSEDGARSFRLTKAEPLPRSFGVDLYQRIFAPPGTADAAG